MFFNQIALIMFIIFQDFLMVQQVLLSPQVKQSIIFSKKLVYTSCLTYYQTTYDLRSQEIRKYQENLKTSYNYYLMLSLPSNLKNLSLLVKISSKAEIELFPYCAISHENQSLSQIFCEYIAAKGQKINQSFCKTNFDKIVRFSVLKTWFTKEPS